MAKKSGKPGEMRFAIIVAAAGLKEEDIDFKRYTVTNQSDLGADFILRASKESLAKFVQIGTNQPLVIGNSSQDRKVGAIEARVDVKETNSALSDDVVCKFTSDVPKHPNIDVHILAGGDRLSKTASESFQKHQKVLAVDGKQLIYMPNSGIERLVQEYKSTILKELRIETDSSDNDDLK